jgi:recombination protein RecA
MPTAQHLRAQIEANLAKRIPSALTPSPKTAHTVAPTGIREIDELLHGGFPIGALSEIVGPECSGRTSLALTFVANLTQAGKVCAWVDVSDTFHPESAASIGVDLTRLLWIRCGRTENASLPDVSVPGGRMAEKPPKPKPGLPQAGGSHPRMEAKGLSDAVSNLLTVAPRCAEPQPKTRPRSLSNQSHQSGPQLTPFPSSQMRAAPKRKSWSRLEQGLRVSDLLLQAGGFSCIVLDLGSLNAEYALRVPLATWFRFRAAAERLQSNVLLLTQHACSRNSAGLVLRLDPVDLGNVLGKDGTIFTGLEHRADLARQRFVQGNVLPLRKQPQSVPTAQWQVKSVWAGQR